ncbi:MAG: HdeD family acid-resistance protein [Candidatus Omnitrophica bacterium]|nr:HdeD family acid-resistance protein [Candidatus Omnitrophota bacterium]
MTDIMSVNRKWFMAAGIILILLGTAAIMVPIVASLAIEILFGWILLVGGLAMIVHSFRALDTGKCLLRLLVGVTYLAIGGMFLFYPMKGVITLTLLLAVLFTFEGIIKIAIAVQIRPTQNWGWMLVSGIAALIISAIIYSGFPGDVVWVIGLLVGINLVFGGWTMIMLSSATVTE